MTEAMRRLRMAEIYAKAPIEGVLRSAGCRFPAVVVALQSWVKT